MIRKEERDRAKENQREQEETSNMEYEQPSETEDVEALKRVVEEEKSRAEANMAGWQRAQADFTNYKRRTEQEKAEIGNFAKAELATAILPVLDNLELALDAVPESLSDDAWVDGVKLIARSLLSALEMQGLSRIEAIGQPFDPNVHEAAAYSLGEEGIVIRELKKGYKLNERVIRPSSVIVGNGKVEDEAKKEE